VKVLPTIQPWNGCSVDAYDWVTASDMVIGGSDVFVEKERRLRSSVMNCMALLSHNRPLVQEELSV